MGCGGSKTNAATPADKKEDTIITPAEQPKPAENTTPASPVAPKPTALLVKIVSAHGLRPADAAGKKSDVFVEVYIEGKPDSKATTAVVTGQAAQRPGAEEGEKDSVEVELNFTGQLLNFVEGDKVVFTVKDKDMLMSDSLGKAVVSDGNFGGRLELENAGTGFNKAFLMVQLGDGAGLSAALDHMKLTLEETKQKLAAAADLAASGDPTKMVEAAAAAGTALASAATDLKDVAMEGLQETEGSVCCLCGEEPKKKVQ